MYTSKEQQTLAYTDFIGAIECFDERYHKDINPDQYFGFSSEPVLSAESALISRDVKSIAYFSMEFGIAPSIYNSFQLSRPMSKENQFLTHEVFSNYWLCDYLFKVHIDKMLDIPIYGGGLGVLAGDAMKSSADLSFSVVGVGILWNKGYFKQNFWYKHGQVPEELSWDPSTYPGLIPLKNRVAIETNEGTIYLRLWKYYVYSQNKGHAVPIILMDANLDENSPKFRRLTDQLYRSDVQLPHHVANNRRTVGPESGVNRSGSGQNGQRLQRCLSCQRFVLPHGAERLQWSEDREGVPDRLTARADLSFRVYRAPVSPADRDPRRHHHRARHPAD